MSQIQYDSSPNEGWQDLVAWDDELYDPFFQGENNYTGAQDSSFAASYHLSGSVGSEQPYLVSAPPSVADGPPSLGHTVSAPPSILDGPSSFGYAYGTSLSFDTTTTSPLVGNEDGQYFGSFGACESGLLSPLGRITESPILDTRYDRIPNTFEPTGLLESTTDAVFNPYVAGSSRSFSGQDVRVSQVFSNVGTWADQPQIIEPIAESGESRTDVAPITIPQPTSQSYNSAYSPYGRPGGNYREQSRSRAVTIPDTTRRPASYNHGVAHSQRTQRVPPALSVSPVISRHPRSVALSRSTSQSQRKPSTPSPNSDSYGWVSYHPNPLTHRLAPTSTEGLPGRALRGRKRGLTAEQRRHAALMRIVGACSNCQRRKEKCDPGTPCKACLEHYKGDLVNHPCRDRMLSDLSGAFLSDRLGWHPTARSLESFVAPNNLNVLTGITYTIPLVFGFGPTLPVSVHALQLQGPQPLVHKHIIYTWPPGLSSASPHQHAVLPAVLTTDATSNLIQTLDSHLSLLVTHHFRSFPLYCSPLQILREIYIFSRALPTNSPHACTLHHALKLLVLVHIGGDITLPPRCENAVLEQLVGSTMNLPQDVNPTPCFLRAQLGAVMPVLALQLMKQVLSSLEQMFLAKQDEEWPVALAVLITVLMTVESVHYHAAKIPYHASCDTSTSNEESRAVDDEQGVQTLVAFYAACFGPWHARLGADWEGDANTMASRCQNAQGAVLSAEDAFVEGVRDGVRRASAEGYLVGKYNGKREGGDGDMGFFFDRLVARVLGMRL